jgi:Trypsin-like peptidase domain/Effector-associated domain 1
VSLFAKRGFNFKDPQSRELTRTLAREYPDWHDADQLVQQYGVTENHVVGGLRTINMWVAILTLLSAKGKLRDLVSNVAKRTHDSSVASTLGALLSSAELPQKPLSAGPVEADKVTEEEALLFGDNLTVSVAELGTLITTLALLLKLSPSVCRITVNSARYHSYGTGFRVSEDKVLSCHHVLFPKNEKPRSVRADFDHEATEGVAAALTLKGNAATAEGERADDWAVVAVPGIPASCPIIELRDLPQPRENDPAYVIQHPLGREKRLGFVRNMITDIAEARIKYLTDTEIGSSGAPVFDADGHLIAVHHAGGKPTEVAGQLPLLKNTGIRISRILSRLKSKGILS